MPMAIDRPGGAEPLQLVHTGGLAVAPFRPGQRRQRSSLKSAAAPFLPRQADASY